MAECQDVPPRQLDLRNRSIFFNETKRDRGRVKHAILKRHFEAWLPKLGFHSDTVVYVDGFAGRGKYTTQSGVEELGSPLVIYRAAIEHVFMPRLKAQVILIFIEENKQNARTLKSNMNQERQTEKVLWTVLAGKFADHMSTLLEYTDCPMFVFADPFGYSGTILPMSLMRELAQRPATELLINVMDSYALRFGMQEQSRPSVSALLGCDYEYWGPKLQDENQTPDDRRERFMDLYKHGLSQDCRLHFLQFGIRRAGNNTHVYHLLFATQHPKGVEGMKFAMWKETQEADHLVFSEYVANKGMVDLPALCAQIEQNTLAIVKKRFAGNMVSGAEIIEFVLLKTLYEVKKKLMKLGLQDFFKTKLVSKSRKFEDFVYEFPVDISPLL